MKKMVYFLLAFSPIFTQSAQAQLWQVDTLRTGIIGAWTRTADFDQDNDPDILVQSGDTIFWHENLRPGWSTHIIDTTFYNSEYAYVDVVDMDGDGDMDVLKIPEPGTGGDSLTWNENISGGTEWKNHFIITTVGTGGWMQDSWGDLDSDGDLDLVVPEYDFAHEKPISELYWLEQIDSSGWRKHILGTGIYWFSTVADMDGDDDPDIVFSQNGLSWLENQLPDTNWVIHPMVETGPFTFFVGDCADLNGDTMPDVISVGPDSTNHGLVSYTNSAWDSVSIAPSSLSFLYFGYPADIDGDGDPDITYSGGGGALQALGWAENQDNGTTWVMHDVTEATELQMIPTGLADIDGDGDQDIVALIFDFDTSLGTAIWLANPGGTTGLQNRNTAAPLSEMKLYPNPFSTQLNIEYQLPEAGMVRLSVCDLFGRPVCTLEQGRQAAGVHTLAWDGRMDSGALAARGVYVMRLEMGDQVVCHRLIWLGR